MNSASDASAISKSGSKSRVMYMECKAESLNGPARIGRVTFSKTGKSLYYNATCSAASRAPGLRRITATKIHRRNIGSRDRAAMERIACTSATFPLRSMRMYEKNTGAKFERSLNSRTGRKLSGRQLPSLFDTCPPKRNHRNGFRIVNRRSMSCPSCKSSE
jgi:hypothetical protein